jgi:hypothetical protein
MKATTESGGTGARGIWLALGVVALVLLALFRAVLSPGEVLHANDGPLGLLKNHEGEGFGNLQSVWFPCGWIGGAQPSGAPTMSVLLYLAVSAVTYAKLHAPLALLFLGGAAAFFCRRAGFSPVVAVLTGLAAAMNSNAVSYACWGLPPKPIAQGMALVAMALMMGNGAGWRGWVRAALAGLAVGTCVMEGADVGAILSLFVAAFVVWQVWALRAEGAKAWGADLLKGGGRLAVVVVFAGWMAAHSLVTLISTQIIGVAGMQEGTSKEERWAYATSWSFPKIETLRVVVPGLFGYRMDTPGGGAYWGAVGSDGTPETRFSGAGEYAGILVVLVASLALASSLRREKGVLTLGERRMVWFWGLVAVGSLVISWGRFAPFYRVVFELPYFSTIRMPSKFLHVMHLALWVLFAYGLEVLFRASVSASRIPRESIGDQVADWKRTATTGEQRWVMGVLIALGVAVAAALLLTTSAGSLKAQLAKIPFGANEPATVGFVLREVWLAVLFFAMAAVVVLGCVVGWFRGTRATWAGWLLGAILVVDLFRANVPWVEHYDARMRYQSDAVLDVLREKPWEHRVTSFLDPRRAGPLVGGEAATTWVYFQKEWLEHQFQYFRIQSLDISQMPRMPELEAAYFSVLSPGASPSDLRVVSRLWELTGTRYVLGSRDVVEQLNQAVDPVERRLKLRMPFALGVKAGVATPTQETPLVEAVQRLEAVAATNGPFALLEFTGALPRVKLYTDWKSGLSDAEVLAGLKPGGFGAWNQVWLSEKIGEPPASPDAGAKAEITEYAAKRVLVETRSSAPAVLLLNDRWHPNWQVRIDGQLVPLLRANFIMRGVQIPEGDHQVEFLYQVPGNTLWISMAALGVGMVLMGLLVVRK